MWLEHLARRTADVEAYTFPFEDRELDFRPLLESVAKDRLRGRDSGSDRARVSSRYRKWLLPVGQPT